MSAPREVRCDLRACDLGERHCSQAPTMRLPSPVRNEPDPALACLLKDPSRNHDRTPVTNPRMLRNIHPDALADAD